MLKNQAVEEEETSVTNCKSTPCNIPEERSSQVHLGESQKFRILLGVLCGKFRLIG